MCALPQARLFHVGRYRFHAASSGIGIDSIVDPPPEGPARDPSQDVLQVVDGGDHLADVDHGVLPRSSMSASSWGHPHAAGLIAPG